MLDASLSSVLAGWTPYGRVDLHIKNKKFVLELLILPSTTVAGASAVVFALAAASAAVVEFGQASLIQIALLQF